MRRITKYGMKNCKNPEIKHAEYIVVVQRPSTSQKFLISRLSTIQDEQERSISPKEDPQIDIPIAI